MSFAEHEIMERLVRERRGILDVFYDDQFKKLVPFRDDFNSDVLPTASEFIAGDGAVSMEQPADLELGSVPDEVAVPLDHSEMEQALAFGTEFARVFTKYAPRLIASGLKVSACYTLILAAWNIGRGSGEDIPAFQREVRELSASAGLATVVPILETMFDELLGNLECLPRFERDIGYLRETFKGIIGSFWGAATVAVAVGTVEHDPVNAKKWLFVAWPVSFFFAQNGMDGLNVFFGKEMLVGGSASRSAWSTVAKRGAIKGIKGLADRNVWLRKMLPYFVAHYAHHHYADPMLAWSDETEKHYLYLAFACFFFFASAKLLFTVGEIVTTQPEDDTFGQGDLEAAE